MNSRLFLLLLIIPLTCFTACERKEKAVLDLHVEEKVIEVKHSEVKLDDNEEANSVAAQQSSQTAPRKMSDNSEITTMLDGFGNKLERRYFTGHPRLKSVLIRTAADGRREIIVYGQNGERSSVESELVNRLMSASAEEIANAAKIYGTRVLVRKRSTAVENEQIKPETPALPPSVPPPDIIQQNETTVKEQIQETPKNTDSTPNPPAKAQSVSSKR